MGFIEKREKQQDAAMEKDRQAYHTLCRSDALGQLNPNQEEKLGGLMDRLGVTIEQYRQDKADFKLEVDLTAKSEGREAVLADQRAQRAILDKLDADWRKSNDEYHARRGVLDANVKRLNTIADDKKKADQELKQLWQRRHELFDRDSWEVVRRKKHLVQTIFTAAPPVGEFEVCSIESLMASPTRCGSPENWIVEPLPNQSPQECEALLGLAKMMFRQPNRRYRYALSAVDLQRVGGDGCKLLAMGGTDGSGPSTEHLDASIDFGRVFFFIDAPQQQDREANVAALRAAWVSYCKSKGVHRQAPPTPPVPPHPSGITVREGRLIGSLQ